MEAIKFEQAPAQSQSGNKIDKFSALTEGQIYHIHKIRKIDTKYGKALVVEMSEYPEFNGITTYFAPSTFMPILRSYKFESVLSSGNSEILLLRYDGKIADGDRSRYSYVLTKVVSQPSKKASDCGGDCDSGDDA